MLNRQMKVVISLGSDRTDPNGEPFRDVTVSVFRRTVGAPADDFRWDRHEAWCSFEHTGAIVREEDVFRLAATALTERADLL